VINQPRMAATDCEDLLGVHNFLHPRTLGFGTVGWVNSRFHDRFFYRAYQWAYLALSWGKLSSCQGQPQHCSYASDLVQLGLTVLCKAAVAHIDESLLSVRRLPVQHYELVGLGVDTEFTLEVIPPKGAVLYINRVTPVSFELFTLLD